MSKAIELLESTKKLVVSARDSLAQDPPDIEMADVELVAAMDSLQSAMLELNPLLKAVEAAGYFGSTLLSKEGRADSGHNAQE